MNELLHKIDTEGPALSQRVLSEMYRDPFWMERFGSKGRRHADEDSDFHLRYLARAIAAGDPEVLVRYARWLREVLATRGMCTRHLDKNFRLLGEAIAGEAWPGRELALGFLRAAREGLEWKEGAAGALERDAGRLASAIERAGLEEASSDLVSYLIDAVALERPDLFAAHVAWMQSHFERQGSQPDAWHAVVDALADALDRSGTHLEARECLRFALAAKGPR